ncbi:tyrosine-type recombinase/integrase [Nocardia wallacei]|uniref:tyrosine-type recombinase/integrase n=1 Tax=Nocardia wallacei TaxID=480035 RepID=UPI002453BDEF|nr:tyrosine-type recombinase/integrase [Nocardia wallacei]
MLTPRPRRRSDGTIAWQVQFQYYDEEHIRRRSSETFDDYPSAEKWAGLIDKVGITHALAVLQAQRAAADEISLVDWVTRDTDRRFATGAVSEPVYRKYCGYIRNDIAPFYLDMPITGVTQASDAAWVVYLEQDKGNAVKTIHNKHGFLSGAMRAAAQRRPEPLIPYNPCADTRLPVWHEPELDIFDNAEWELFEQLLAPQWRAQAEFGLTSMARPGEIGALRVGDIRVGSTSAAVRISKAWKDCGSRIVLGTPKTRRGTRTVDIPLRTATRLDLDRDRDELLFSTAIGTPVTAAAFYDGAWAPALRRLDALAHARTALASGKPVHARSYFTPFTRAARWIGADPEDLLARYGPAVATLCVKRLTPYTLRHTGISWKLQDGVPIFVVSRDAGHESVAVTDRRYGHNDRRASEKAAAVIAERLPAARAEMLALAA